MAARATHGASRFDVAGLVDADAGDCRGTIA